MKNNFKILLVEDELMIAEMAKEMLLDLDYQVIGMAKNYQEAKTLISELSEIDMIILDINLNDWKSGIDLGKEINENYKIPFIYLTSYSDPSTIQTAAQTAPSAYLLKPFTKSDLYTTLEIIRARKVQNNNSILVKYKDLKIKIATRDILYIKSDNNYIDVVTDSKSYTLRNSIERFLGELDDSNFIKTHRSYAVNIIKIKAINGQYILIGDEKLPLSRSYKNEVLSQFTID